MRSVFISLFVGALSLMSLNGFGQGKLIPKFSEEEGKYGYIYEYDTAEFEIEPQFVKAFPFIENYGRVQTDSGYYLINTKGKPVNEDVVEQIGWSDDEKNATYSYFYFDHIGFQKDGKWGLMNKEGEIIVKPIYQDFQYYIRKLAPVSKYDSLTNKVSFGAINLTGKEIIPFKYTAILPIYGSINVLVEQNVNGKLLYGVLAQNGKEVIRTAYTKIFSLKNGLYAVLSQLGLWAVFNEKGKQLQDFQYEEIQTPNSYGEILVKKDGLWGILKEDGSLLKPTVYTSITATDSSYQYQKAKQFQIVNGEGKVLKTVYADSLHNIYPNVYRYHVDGRIGLWNIAENTLDLNSYDYIEEFWENGQSLVRKGDLYGVIDAKGNAILPLRFTEIYLEPNQMYRVANQDRTFDLYNFKGQNLTNHQYKLIDPLSSDLFLVKKGDKYGYLGKNLSVKIPFDYKNAESFRGKHAVVRKDDYYGVIDMQQNWVISPVVDHMQSIKEDLFLIRDQGVWGTLDINGIELYRSVGETYQIREDGSVLLKYANLYGLLNDKGEFCLPTAFEYISPIKEDETVSMSRSGVNYFMNIYEDQIPMPGCYDFADRIDAHHEQYAVIQKGEYFGFVDYLGRLRISLRYDNAKHFSEDVAPVEINKRWGYLNKRDLFEIQPNWEDAEPFVNGTAIVKMSGKYGVIKRDGSLLIPYKYEHIERSPKGNWLIKKGGKVGILTYTADQSIYEKYDDVVDLGNGFIFSVQNGKYGLDKIDGYSVLFPVNDKLEYNSYDETYQLISFSESHEELKKK